MTAALSMSPLVEIGLTDLSKSGGATASLAPPGTTTSTYYSNFNIKIG